LRPTTLLMNNSKRALSLIVGASAALAAGSLGATSAKAQLTNMLQSGIQRPTAGITIGQTTMAKGTIQYTNSAGTNDSFSVGTSTSIAANASASSTSDYSVTSVASFDMGNNNTDGPGGLSVISQQIGRSQLDTQTKALDTSLQTNLAATAETKAAEMTASGFKAVDGSGVEIDIVEVGLEEVVTMAAGNASIELSQWTGKEWQEFTNDPAGVDALSAADKFQAAYSAEETLNYDEAFTEAVSEASFAATGDGVISGQFEKNAGSSLTSNYEQVSQVNAGTGAIVTDSDFDEIVVTSDVKDALSAYQADSSTSSSYTDTATGSTFDFTDTDTVSAIQSTETNSSYGVSTTNNSTFALDTVVVQNSSFEQLAPTTNIVSVQGINSENNIVSDDSAEFSSTITKDIASGVTTSSGTASGSATGNVTTTASASASSSSFINSFVQAY